MSPPGGVTDKDAKESLFGRTPKDIAKKLGSEARRLADGLLTYGYVLKEDGRPKY